MKIAQAEIYRLLAILLVITILSLAGCGKAGNLELPKGEKREGIECFDHNQCASGVCDRIKQAEGKCAAVSCETGQRASYNEFFCNEKHKWSASIKEDGKCGNDYECYQPTCANMPNCDATDVPRTKALCKDNICFYEIAQDECEKQGMKRILAKGSCGSMAQMILPTICAHCGDGICNQTIEGYCNCPEDCK